jgi:hypothetical protein
VRIDVIAIVKKAQHPHAIERLQARVWRYSRRSNSTRIRDGNEPVADRKRGTRDASLFVLNLEPHLEPERATEPVDRFRGPPLRFPHEIGGGSRRTSPTTRRSSS